MNALAQGLERFSGSAILVVDDLEDNRELLRSRLTRDGYRVYVAANGEEALHLLRHEAIDLVLLDIMMPIMDGYEALRHMKEDATIRHIPVVVISAVDEIKSAVQCIEQGAEDYIGKPFNPTLLRARVNACLNKKKLHDLECEHKEYIQSHNRFLEERVREQVGQISSAQLAAIFSMSKLAESKDPETGEHLERMREYCITLSRQIEKLDKYQGTLGRKFHDNLYTASPLHDIGKVGIPDEILLKPGRLTEREWAIMRTHPEIGAATLRAVDRQYPGNEFIRTGIDIAECHHEKWDGSGYPNGLRGDAIPLVARILALGDVYDALTSKRCYKEAFSHEKSRSIIIEQSGRHFDPNVVNAFLATEDEFMYIRNHFQDPDNEGSGT